MLKFLQRMGVRKGVLGGSGPWLVVAVAAWLLRKASGNDPDTVFSHTLTDGETLVIAHGREPAGES